MNIGQYQSGELPEDTFTLDAALLAMLGDLGTIREVENNDYAAELGD